MTDGLGKKSKDCAMPGGRVLFVACGLLAMIAALGGCAVPTESGSGDDEVVVAGDSVAVATETGSAEQREQGVAPAGDIYETVQIAGPVGGQNLMSTDVERPADGWAELTVRGAYATSVRGESTAGPGEKYLVVEYQVLGLSQYALLNPSSFRVNADGVYYSPTAGTLNLDLPAGRIIRWNVVFTIPADVAAFRLEAGAADPDGDGYQANFDMTLSAAQAPAEPVYVTGPDETGEVTKLSELAEFTGSPGNPEQPPLEIEIIEARVTFEAAPPGVKFVSVEAQVTSKSGLTYLSKDAFRIATDGELFGGRGDLGETLIAGESWIGTMWFTVPADASTFELEVGVPAIMENGHRAVFEITFT